MEGAAEGFVRWSDVVIRKGTLSLVPLAVCGAAAVFFFGRLPSSFVPDEDQGYVYISRQLPVAASLERTSAAAQQAIGDMTIFRAPIDTFSKKRSE